MAALCMNGLFAFEDGGIQRRKEFVVQRVYSAREVGLRYHEADIQQARALADHADVDAIERVKYAARHAGRVADVFANEANDHAIVLDGGFRELAQLAEDQIEA